jgi:hypothetical protein
MYRNIQSNKTRLPDVSAIILSYIVAYRPVARQRLRNKQIDNGRYKAASRKQ